VRFAWDKIWGSNFYGTLTTREVDLDEERSGQQYDLTHGTQYAAMLDRNGKVHDMAALLPVPLRRQPVAGAGDPLQAGQARWQCGELRQHRVAADLRQAAPRSGPSVRSMASSR
jgi:hypothetical protein